MTALISDCDSRTYFISSCNNLVQVKANKKTAIDVIDLFCTITAVKEYPDSSLIKTQNYQITEDLLHKVLQRTLSDDITLTEDEEKTLEPYSQRLQRLSESSE